MSDQLAVDPSSFVAAGWREFDCSEQSHPDTLFLELPRHLKRNHAAKTIATQMIRPVRLQGANFPDVMRRHVFDAGEGFRRCNQSVGRLVGAQKLGDLSIGEEPAATSA